ncbi:adenylate/guanylate cyclase domain-containing protein (plasmid) [Ensifer adhaerens]|uniref:adenylate/guanylate cyclase domain-containing protein n=1 Tax=Ensifer adhaerens TaxID=106592 RepID=UPI0023A96EF8|nr:adenylate/guanylate cyclase domain-containing protein [Ensifer adhaerens]WDZ79914.1 adenylate/guanylate cyclase domain-containing protein [Ensifer adhaerens]
MRKLAAVLCIDVAGYSKLMGRDEAGTLARVKAAFAAFDPALARHHGRIVKLMGDGALIEFASAVDATLCAMALQSVAVATDPSLRFRMGLNLGDVIAEDGDLYGEGVNIAARLQALARPGGIILSEAVREHIAGKLSLALEDLGPTSLKNIERAVRAFAIQAGGPAETTGKRERIGICVLPFTNMSGDPEQDYFSAGVTEDIIIDLSKLSPLSVVSRATSFGLKAQSARIVAQQLDVAYILEGSVRKVGDRIRLAAQLIDGSNEATVWAERFDRDIRDVLLLQSDLASAVVEALRLQLLPSERQALERTAPTDPEAYKLFLLAREYNISGSERHLPLIIRLCRRVTELEPGNARAWALLGETLNRLRRSVGGAETGELEIDRALELDPGLASAHAAKALLFLYRGEFGEAERQCAIALQLEPDDYATNLAAGRTCLMRRRYDDAIRHFERAAALAPADYNAAAMAIQCYQGKGDEQAALAACRRALARIERIVAAEPDHSGAIGHGAGILALLGDRERANEWASRASLLEPDNIQLQANLVCAWAISGDAEAALNALERIASEISGELLVWMENDNDLDSLRSLPRFAQIIRATKARFVDPTLPEGDAANE